MQEQSVIDLLTEHGSFHKGHFVFTAGETVDEKPHSNFYIDCAATLRDPRATMLLANEMGRRIVGVRPDIIVTPSENAIPLGIPIAHFLTLNGNSQNVRAIVASKADRKTFAFKRGADKELNGRRVAVIEDLWSTGSSTRAVVAAAVACGAEVVAVAAIVNRGNVQVADIGVVGDFFSLCEVDGVPHLPSSGTSCPWCMENIPMRTDYGHGGAWCNAHPDYPIAA